MAEVLYSYTFTCPKCCTMQSYAPAPGEEVRCTHRKDREADPCGEVMEKLEER